MVRFSFVLLGSALLGVCQAIPLQKRDTPNIALTSAGTDFFSDTSVYAFTKVSQVPSAESALSVQASAVITDIQIVTEGNGYNLKWKSDGGCNGWNSDDGTVGYNNDCSKWTADARIFNIRCMEGSGTTGGTSKVCSLFHGDTADGLCVSSDDDGAWKQHTGCSTTAPVADTLFQISVTG